MKVHLIRKETIEAFARLNSQSRTALEEWLAKVKKQTGKNLQICKQHSELLIYLVKVLPG